MVPRGHRVINPVKDEEQRENGEKNQQGLPIPPPPPIADFSVVM